jgi:hypothetical protein
MSFIVMGPAEGIAIVVSVATASEVRERDILVMIVANPVPAAIGFSDLSDFATQATARLLSLGLRCSHLSLARYAGPYSPAPSKHAYGMKVPAV